MSVTVGINGVADGVKTGAICDGDTVVVGGIGKIPLTTSEPEEL